MALLRHTFALLLILLTMTDASMAATAPSAADSASAEQFLRRVYASYANDGPGVPSDKLQESDVYDASLIALMEADQDNAAGEVGFLDGDPLCDCQDWGDIRIQSLALTALEGDRLKASLALKDASTGEGRKLDLLLHRTAQGWRVEDCISGQGSLAENLRRSTRKLLQEKKDAAPT